MNHLETRGVQKVDGDLRAPSEWRSGPDGARRSPSTFQRWLHGALADLSPQSTILAVGCEEAFLGPQLLEYASHVTVLDTCGGQIAQLARRFPEISFLRHQPAKRLPFPAEAFDVACCCELLDRVFDPQAALQELHRVLAPGGRLLLTVPDGGAMRKVLRAIFGRGTAVDAAHPRLHHFTRRALTKAVRTAGFRDIHATVVETSRRMNDTSGARVLLKARRGPEVRRAASVDEPRAEPAAWTFDEELAFAGRSRAA